MSDPFIEGVIVALIAALLSIVVFVLGELFGDGAEIVTSFVLFLLLLLFLED